jgi:hypothetical protein
MNWRLHIAVLLALVAVSLPAAEPAGKVDFNRDIRSILSNKCHKCHGPDPAQRKGGSDGLRLDLRHDAIADQGGQAAIVPGDAAKSELIARVRSSDPDQRMPPPETGPPLSAREVKLLTEWINQGANYAEHWSYATPIRPALPIVKQSTWPRNAIDYFILARLEREGLAPGPEADEAAILRRASLDLTGLPPVALSSNEDQGRHDFEPHIDSLLASPRFGEHWAHSWLDLARYADSTGYADDPPRTIWLFRDYVIRSFNANKPLDQFTVEQIAGDLLPNPTQEQLIATAFHRNTLTNNEGGTNDEEFRNVAVVDRVNTTLAVWMGTTAACAQCHNHKYDPITQEEYFRLFAFFNSSEDADRKDEAPVLALPTPAELQQKAALEAEIKELEESLAKEMEKKDEAGAKKLEQLKKKLADFKPLSVPIMRELPADKRRVTKLQQRGNFLDLAQEVSAGTPAAFPPLPGGMAADRLALAKWLVDQDNPLTARVLANRYWEQLFGVGLVATSEEFGSQGDLPSHPELLDWLATELIRLQWDHKAFLRLLVTSATYRQSSRVTPEQFARDPDNRLLARGPRVRLSAEMIRDQALAVGGLLSSKMFGPPVKPPQPTLDIKAAFGSGIDWQASTGDDKFRRALYTTWRRSNPYPSMAAFDAPNREVCIVRRDRTNTPLQALVTLNDPVYIEAAQALARRIGSWHERSPRARIDQAFRECLSRPPHAAEANRLLALYDQALADYRGDVPAATKMATEPIGPAPAKADIAELAAWTVVANVLLNLDEMVMKR